MTGKHPLTTDARYWLAGKRDRRPLMALAYLPILQAHVRLAWQTGNHLNVLSISADDPTRTLAVLPPD
jgi:hypothetical protein